MLSQVSKQTALLLFMQIALLHPSNTGLQSIKPPSFDLSSIVNKQQSCQLFAFSFITVFLSVVSITLFCCDWQPSSPACKRDPHSMLIGGPESANLSGRPIVLPDFDPVSLRFPSPPPGLWERHTQPSPDLSGEIDESMYRILLHSLSLLLASGL